MRRYIGVALITLAFISMFLFIPISLFILFSISIYIIGLILLLWPERKEVQPPQPTPAERPPTPDDIKKRPAKAPEI